MILIAGSKLVVDAGKNDDLDVVYATLNPVKYFLYVRLKKHLEKELSRRHGIPVSFSPYLVLSPTIVGNMFIAITLLRYPYTKSTFLLKLSIGKKDRRWILLHTIFAYLGLLTSSNPRDFLKYGSMLAENILYTKGLMIPRSWRKTIELACVVIKIMKLKVTEKIFEKCLECAKHVEKEQLESIKKCIFSNIAESLNEVLEKLIRINNRGIENAKTRLDNVFRYLHQLVFKFISKRDVQWISCSSLFLSLLYPPIFRKLVAKPKLICIIKKIYNICKYRIPVLSPLAHP